MKKLLVFTLFSVGVMVSPLLLIAAGVPVNPIAFIVVSAAGALFFLGGLAIGLYSKLYVRTKANEAFVRTGKGGAIVILDGGALVIPILHEVIRVPLETMRLDVERVGSDALITADKLRADLKAEFYIRVQPTKDDVMSAARSLGEKNFNVTSIETLVRDKLISSLRSVAATRTLDELNSRREEFAAEVKTAVENDLMHNGLTLETVTISSLDQTDATLMNPSNVFDAQGLRRIAEITQAALVERNLIERSAEEERTRVNVSTRKKVLEMEKDRAEAEAAQAAEVATIRATREAEARQAEIQQEELVAQREVEKQRAVEQANLQAQQRIIEARREQQLEEVSRSKAVEVANRQRLMAIAAAEAEKADADRLRFEKEAARAEAEQAVMTVEVVATADRQAEQKLILAKKKAEEERYQQQVEADVIAYSLAKEAEGKQLAAEAEAQATLQAAQADAEASRLRAEGKKALEMVGVNVERERVGLDRDRVNVERERVAVEAEALANKEQYSEAALRFELDKARIEAEKDTKIAVAGALGEFLGASNFTMFGDPASAQQMIDAYMRGMGLGQHVDGFISGTTPQTQAVLGTAAGHVFDLVKAVAERISGREVDAAEVAKIVEQLNASDEPDTAKVAKPAEESEEPPKKVNGAN